MMTTLERATIYTLSAIALLTALLVASSYVTPLFGRDAAPVGGTSHERMRSPPSGPACYLREA
jgi:hypothetical protein